jgi:hypothetical protein
MSHALRRPMRHWVCFDCRKQFRKPLMLDGPPTGTRVCTAVASPCPECKGDMTDMGTYFRPPARDDLRSWNHYRRIAEHGYRFMSEGSIAWLGYVVEHTTRRLDADILIGNCSCQDRTEGQRLLRRIEAAGAQCGGRARAKMR